MRRFNVTGTCVKHKHYMADTTSKVDQMIALVENEYYFTINRPRQYGKTTMLSLLRQRLADEYLVLSISFQGVSSHNFESDELFIEMFRSCLEDRQIYINDRYLDNFIESLKTAKTMTTLNRCITTFTSASPKGVLLLIDECDEGTNNEVFIKFLGMLRQKYLDRTEGFGATFQSVILTGVHDIKNVKFKIRGDEERYNSPWNIAEEFRVDMSFDKLEIESLLFDYLSEHSELEMDVSEVASKIHYFTNGHPFFVSYLCKMFDEEFEGVDRWNVSNLEIAVSKLLVRKITNLDSLIKNIISNADLEKLVHAILIDGNEFEYSISGPAMEKGLVYGIFGKSVDNRLIISNPIYEMKIYKYLTDKMRIEESGLLNFPAGSIYIKPDGSLDMGLILKNYSRYLAELRDDKTDKFIENNARLLFSIFMKPIINGVGFMYKEVVISDRKRLDVLVTYNEFKYVIELKIWRGQAYYEEAQVQLCEYLDREGLSQGYMIVHDFRKTSDKRNMTEQVSVGGKRLDVYFV